MTEDSVLFQILYQAAGVFGLICGFLSYQAKQTKYFYIFQAVCGFFFAIQFGLAVLTPVGVAYAGLVINLTNIVRGLTFAFSKSAREKWYFAIFLLVAYVGLGVCSIVFWGENVWLGILVIAAQIASTIIMKIGQPFVIRVVSISMVSPCWMVYDIFKFSVGGILTEVFNMTSIAIAMIRAHREKQKAGSSQPETPAQTEEGKNE